MSTFVAECDGPTWQACGLDRMSDDERKRMVEDIFAPELAGATLIDNKSVWCSFNVITNERWTHRNIALLGDALRSAHFQFDRALVLPWTTRPPCSGVRRCGRRRVAGCTLCRISPAYPRRIWRGC
jgi:hypothetical protein